MPRWMTVVIDVVQTFQDWTPCGETSPTPLIVEPSERLNGIKASAPWGRRYD